MLPTLQNLLLVSSLPVWLPIYTQAHMQMSWPYPLRSPLDPAVPEGVKDYSMTAPLNSDGSNNPCKRYQYEDDSTYDSFVTKATYSAGGFYNLTLAGTASHLGGSCQISLSYDNGASFKVIKSIIGGCPLNLTYGFTVPSFALSSNSVLLSWSWFNIVGNREMYQNCARVQIQGDPNQRHRRRIIRRQSAFNNLPDLFECNVGNGCTTIERREVIFPNPGSDVSYGQDAITPDSGPGYTLTTTPNGNAFTNGTTSSSTSTASGSSSTATTGPSSTSTLSQSSVSTDSSLDSTTTMMTTVIIPPTTLTISGGNSTTTLSQSPGSTFTSSNSNTTSMNAVTIQSGTSTVVNPNSTTTVLTTVIITPYPGTNTTNTSGPTGTETGTGTGTGTGSTAGSITGSSSQQANFAVSTSVSSTSTISSASSSSTNTQAISTSSSIPYLLPFNTVTNSRTSSTTSISTTSVTTTTPTTTRSTSTSSSSATSPTNTPINLSGPCTPGTFACNSPTTFSQCVGQGSGATSYIYMGSVAAGMQCVNGNFVRQNDGPCSPDGSIVCKGTNAFYMCDHGVLINMGPVAPGTACRNGVIGFA